jgi:hypothetical protein
MAKLKKSEKLDLIKESIADFLTQKGGELIPLVEKRMVIQPERKGWRDLLHEINIKLMIMVDSATKEKGVTSFPQLYSYSKTICILNRILLPESSELFVLKLNNFFNGLLEEKVFSKTEFDKLLKKTGEHRFGNFDFHRCLPTEEKIQQDFK